MVLTNKTVKNVGEVKHNVKNYHECPLCKEKFELGIEWDTLQKLHDDKFFPYPHIHLHGDPIHAMLVYIDKDMCIRGISKIKSIEISRDSVTFQQIMKKWSNPF